MKLRNKKTGEIVNADFNAIISGRTNIIIIQNGAEQLEYNSLAELNEEWEDVPEEPKEYWYIDYDGGILCGKSDNSSVEKVMISMGNCFDTLEEADKAVERLRAWKRLKDYNVKFNLDFVRNRINFTYSTNNPLLDVLDGEEQIFNNMKIVFGGEE